MIAHILSSNEEKNDYTSTEIRDKTSDGKNEKVGKKRVPNIKEYTQTHSKYRMLEMPM